LKVLAAWPGMAHRLAAERQREAAERQRDAMFEAWGGVRTSPVPAASADGFQAVAMSLSQRGTRPAAAGRGLLDPVPAGIAVARHADKRQRPHLQEVAEAAPRRR
jgi:hypothetical protein